MPESVHMAEKLAVVAVLVLRVVMVLVVYTVDHSVTKLLPSSAACFDVLSSSSGSELSRPEDFCLSAMANDMMGDLLFRLPVQAMASATRAQVAGTVEVE